MSSALALLVGEAAARVTTPYQRSISWYHYDARYEFRHRSSMDAMTTEWGEGHPWRFRTNSRGFRGAEWAPAPRPGVKRVVVMGDSFTFGNAVDETEAYPAVAERSVRAAHPGQSWEVLNLGASAWGPENALAYLESEGADIRGDYLVYGFYLGNDLLDYRRSRLYTLKGGVLEPRPRASAATPLARVRGAARRLPAYDFLLAHSQLFNVIRKAAIEFWARGRGPAAEGNVGVGVPAPRPGGPDAGAAAAELTEPVAVTTAVLDHLDLLAHERFRRFQVLLIPTRELLLARERPPGGAAWWADQSRRSVLDWCARRNVRCLDLLPQLPRGEGEVRSLFFERDFHCNAAGNARIGELLAEGLNG